MPVLFDVEVQDENRTETVSFLTLENEPSDDNILELQLVELLVRLRAADPEMYEFIWDLAVLADERGAPMDAITG